MRSRVRGDRALVGLTTCFLACGLAAHGQDNDAVPTFASEASVVVVDVVVLDREGRPVSGISREDFEVYEDGRLQEVTRFEARELSARPAQEAAAFTAAPVATNQGRAAGEGRLLAFIIDDVALSHVPGIHDARQAVMRWLDEAAEERDQVTIATTSGDVWWSDTVGRGRGDLRAVLDRLRGKRPPGGFFSINEWDAYAATTGPSTATATGALGASRGSVPGRGPGAVVAPTKAGSLGALEVQDWTERQQRSLLRVVRRLSQGLEPHAGRKSLFILSESFLYIPEMPELREAIEASRLAGTAVYFLDVRGLVVDADIDLTERKVAGGENLADKTGGAVIRSGNDLTKGIVRAVDESSAYYTLGYPSPRAPDGKWHDLEVKLPGRKGYEIRARKGYYAAREKRGTRAEKRDDGLMTPALASGVKGGVIPLRLACRLGDDGGRVLVSLDVGTSGLAFVPTAEGPSAALEITIVTVALSDMRPRQIVLYVRLSGGDESPPWWTLAREVVLPPGVAQVRVLVRDTHSDEVGLVSQRVDVPALPEAMTAR